MQARVHWMFPLSFVAVDHWLPVMKMLLSVERYQQQHPKEANRDMKKVLILIPSVNCMEAFSIVSPSPHFSAAGLLLSITESAWDSRKHMLT